MLNHKNTHTPNEGKKNPGLNIVSCALLAACFMLPLAVSATVYKWVDEDGKTHYGSQRPQDVEAETVKIDTPSPYRQPDAPTEEKEEQKDESGKQEAKPEAAKPAEPPAPPPLSRKEKKRLCDQSRKRLAMIESRGRLKGKDEQGNVRHLSDAERLNRLKQAREDVAEFCR